MSCVSSANYVVQYVIVSYSIINAPFISLGMEIIGGKWSVLFGIGIMFAWAFGYVILPLIAYYIPQWTWYGINFVKQR